MLSPASRRTRMLGTRRLRGQGWNARRSGWKTCTRLIAKLKIYNSTVLSIPPGQNSGRQYSAKVPQAQRGRRSLTSSTGGANAGPPCQTRVGQAARARGNAPSRDIRKGAGTTKVTLPWPFFTSVFPWTLRWTHSCAAAARRRFPTVAIFEPSKVSFFLDRRPQLPLQA